MIKMWAHVPAQGSPNLKDCVTINMLYQDQAVDIANERKLSDIEVSKLTEAFHGGKEVWEMRKSLMSLISTDPVFNKRDRYFLGRTERFKRALAMSKRYVEIRNKN